MNLVVTHAFNGYVIGQQITDPAMVDQILGSEFASCVVKVAASAAPATGKAAKDKDKDSAGA